LIKKDEVATLLRDRKKKHLIKKNKVATLFKRPKKKTRGFNEMPEKQMLKRKCVLVYLFKREENKQSLERLCLKVFPGPYGVATISRLLKIIGLFCKRAQ